MAGVCHARDTNANVPPQWLIYVKVASVAECARRATEAGGAVVDGPRKMGGSMFAVIRDPAGAVIGVI
jgi:predicted enzyme related to lactoylglutathione lyase